VIETGLRVERQRVRCNDVEPAGIALGNLVQRRDRALIAFDGDDAGGAEREERARQAARSGAVLEDGGAGEISRRPRNAGSEIKVEQKILPE
jgi:hypothetical protein